MYNPFKNTCNFNVQSQCSTYNLSRNSCNFKFYPLCSMCNLFKNTCNLNIYSLWTICFGTFAVSKFTYCAQSATKYIGIPAIFNVYSLCVTFSNLNIIIPCLSLFNVDCTLIRHHFSQPFNNLTCYWREIDMIFFHFYFKTKVLGAKWELGSPWP